MTRKQWTLKTHISKSETLNTVHTLVTTQHGNIVCTVQTHITTSCGRKRLTEDGCTQIASETCLQ